ncbi:GNAT family N-acetyltransferase [Pseudorhodobacter aquimaris]|uniref:GNAT family N-acetyltransferase n=1 Tax=Pseudorhodobacter aquimaris TaxID=687412 RepID=UPI00067B39F4|nr:GNAT family N-acetyltransferase [Pseudorhodobacter aquimaris]
MNITLCRDLPAHLRDPAAELYWDAFGSKLGRVMGPRRRALAYLQQSMRADHAICALSPNGSLLGLVGFKTHIGSFAGGGPKEMRAVYGRFGALWRMGLMSLLERDVENERFLLDGICVHATARDQGVGTQLLMAICDEARAQNYPAVRLDVIDSNPRARALYERLGFVAEHTDQLGPLRYIFGFAASTSMIKPV